MAVAVLISFVVSLIYAIRVLRISKSLTTASGAFVVYVRKVMTTIFFQKHEVKFNSHLITHLDNKFGFCFGSIFLYFVGFNHHLFDR